MRENTHCLNTKDFIDFLRNFCIATQEKKNGNGRKPFGICNNRSYSLAIVPIGRHETFRYAYYGHEPYVHFIEEAIKQGVETFYVLARGKIYLFIDATDTTSMEAGSYEYDYKITISGEDYAADEGPFTFEVKRSSG